MKKIACGVILLIFIAPMLKAEEIKVFWITKCEGSLDNSKFYKKENLPKKLEKDYCIYIEDGSSGYRNGFDPIVDDDDLSLLLSGKTFEPGIYKVDLEITQDLPKCYECDGSCAVTIKTEVKITRTEIKNEKRTKFLKVDVKKLNLIKDWLLMKLDLSMNISGPNFKRTFKIKSLNWPWCA